MRSRLRLLAAVAACWPWPWRPGLADARAGGGSSLGSRGSQTWSAPPSTSTAPYAAPMQRSLTPTARGYGQRLRLYRGGGFGSGLMGGLIGVGLGRPAAGPRVLGLRDVRAVRAADPHRHHRVASCAG